MKRQHGVLLVQQSLSRSSVIKDLRKTNSNGSSKKLIEKEKRFVAPIVGSLPVVFARGQGCKVWDIEGKAYLDFLGGIGALQTGHCHPKLAKVMEEQSSTLTLISRNYYNNVLPEFAEKICELFQYEKIIPMTTGEEAGETVLKIAGRWGSMKKKIPVGEAKVFFPEDSFWGRTISAISTTNNQAYFKSLCPFMPGLSVVPFNDLCALKKSLEENIKSAVAYFMEPVLGEAGVIIPSENYLKGVRKLCSEYGVLWIADEIQTGLGRTGKLYACQHENVKPDVLLLGKGLAGGFTPISAILSSREITSVMSVNSYGSTFSGNPLACRLALTTLNILCDEGLIENSRTMGEKFRSMLNECLPKDIVLQIRGIGLMNAIVINNDYTTGLSLCLKLLEAGLLSKASDNSTLRFLPPLTVTETEIKQATDIIRNVLESLKKCC